MSSHYLIVDGNNMLHRVEHVNELTSSAGLPTGGTYGFLRSLAPVLNDTKSTHCVVIWDAGISKFRIENSEGLYKSNRNYDDDSKERQDYFHRFNCSWLLLSGILPKLGVRTYSIPGCEADDIIGIMSRMLMQSSASNNGRNDVTVLSEDMDMYQLVYHGARVYRPIRRLMVDESNFVDTVGITPGLYLAYRAIVGDVSDAIPGVSGAGHATAESILTQLASENFSHYSDAGFLPRMKVIASQGGHRHKKVADGMDVVERNIRTFDMFARDEEIVSVLAPVIKYFMNRPTHDISEVCGDLMSLEFKSIMDNFWRWSTPFRRLFEAS